MKLTQEVEKILIDKGWSAKDIEKFVDAIELIALEYDKKTGKYPEHEYEGLAFLVFCTSMPDPGAVDYLKWAERLKANSTIPMPSMKISTEVITK